MRVESVSKVMATWKLVHKNRQRSRLTRYDFGIKCARRLGKAALLFLRQYGEAESIRLGVHRM